MDILQDLIYRTKNRESSNLIGFSFWLSNYIVPVTDG